MVIGGFVRAGSKNCYAIHIKSVRIQCLGGKCQDHPLAARTWENDRIREFVQSPEYRPSYDISRKNVDFLVKIHVVKTTVEILERIKTTVTRQDHFRVLNDNVTRTSVVTVLFAQNFEPVHLSFLGPGDEEEWYGSLIDKSSGEWNGMAEITDARIR